VGDSPTHAIERPREAKTSLFYWLLIVSTQPHDWSKELMSDTYFDLDDFEHRQGINTTEELKELTAEEFAKFLCCGSLDRDYELN